MERACTARSTDHGEYLLTERGRDLVPVIVTLTEWGDRWAAPAGPPILYVHSVCGGAVTRRTVCAGCGRVHDPAEVTVRPGPGMPPDIAARMDGDPDA